MKKILIIDDNIVVLKTIASMVKNAGFEVISTNSGNEGITMAIEKQPDIILCDIEMPDLNGYDVLISLLNDIKTSSIPFIFMTAARKKKTEQRFGMTLGADDYLTKPFTEEELISSINSRLKKRKITLRENEEKMEKLRSNIVYALPHEFRTPLTTILMSSNFLEQRAEKLDTDEIIKISSRINKAGRKLQRLLENFLLYTQIEVIKSDEDKLKLLNEKITDKPSIIINNIAKRISEENNRTNDLQVNTIDIPLNITQENLEKIIIEILDNAFKFSDKGSQVSVNTEIVDNSYQITITDNGVGMTAEHINNIGAYMQFERNLYEQQGSGFGLAICKKIIEVHSCKMNIESKPDEYTKVRINIPLSKNNQNS